MRNIEISDSPIAALPEFKSANEVRRGGAGARAGNLEIGTGSVGSITSSKRVLAVTRWSLPWNRYVVTVTIYRR